MKKLAMLFMLLASLFLPLTAFSQEENNSAKPQVTAYFVDDEPSDAEEDDSDLVLEEDDSSFAQKANSSVKKPADNDFALKSKLMKGFGYTFLVAGLGIVGAGAGIYVHSQNDYDDKLETYESTFGEITLEELRKIKRDDEKKMENGVAMMAAGSALTVLGILLVVMDATVIQPKLAPASEVELSFAPSVTPEFQGFSLSGRF